MDCADFIFHLFDTTAYYLAAVGAGAAAVFAYRTFREQEKQVTAQQDQLLLLRDEHRAAAKGISQMRLQNCPYFVPPTLQDWDFRICMELKNSEFPGNHISPRQGLIIENPPSKWSEQLIAQASSNQAIFHMPIENRNTAADLREWVVEVLEGPADLMLDLLRVPVAGYGGAMVCPQHLWAIRYHAKPRDISNGRAVRIRIHFETTLGWEDALDYKFSIGLADFARVDPPVLASFTSTARKAQDQGS